VGQFERDPIVAEVTRRRQRRIGDRIDRATPTTLHLVEPPSGSAVREPSR
jgi:hypothetical protein